MDFNEFNRQLQNRVSDGGTRYMLGIVYERLLDLVKQNDQNSTLLLAFAETLRDFIKINELTDAQIKGLQRHITGVRDGVSVESVPITNDDV
jgi:hypothetical protein